MAEEHQQPGPGHDGTHGAPTHPREAMKSDAEGRMPAPAMACIIAAQEREIAQMQTILARVGR